MSLPADLFIGLVFFISIAAGLLGAITSLGGGIVVTPAWTLLLSVDIRYAIGASLASVVATSSGAARSSGNLKVYTRYKSLGLTNALAMASEASGIQEATPKAIMYALLC